MQAFPRMSLLAPLLCILSLACQQQSATPGASVVPPSSPSAATAPVTPKVTRVVLAVPAPGAESPKPTNVSTTNIWPIKPAYEFLWGVSVEGEANVPQLAESWTLGPDGKSFHFQLHKGVQFHRGMGEFTSKDVLYSWEQLTAPDSQEGRRERWLSSVPKVEAVGDYEVVFNLKEPDQSFVWSFGEPDAGLRIMSKADGEARTRWSYDDPAIAGTGPYAITERQQGQFIRFRRDVAPHYRKTPDFPEFEFRYVKENSTRLAALLTKEIQIAALPLDLIPQAEAKGMKAIKARAQLGFQTFIVFLGPSVNKKYTAADPDPVPGGQPYRYMNTPLLDGRVRQALNKAINRDELNKAFFKGQGEPIYNTFFHPTRPGWNPDWVRRFPQEYGYDPEAAKRLLAEAGYGPNNPLKHTLLTVSFGLFPELSDMVEAIANYWRAIGVDVTIDNSDPAVQTQKRNRQEYDNHSYIAGTSVRQFFGFGAYGVGNGYVGGRSGAEFIEPSEVFQNQLRWTFDQSKLNTLWRQVGDMAYDLKAPAPLFWLPTYAVVDPNLVADYPFSGTTTGTYTNVEYIKAAK